MYIQVDLLWAVTVKPRNQRKVKGTMAVFRQPIIVLVAVLVIFLFELARPLFVSGE